jgi:hypothetical protein
MAGRLTPETASMLGKIGAYSNLAKHGRKAAGERLRSGHAQSLRARAIEMGATTEAEIAERVADLRRVQGLKGAAARWGER